MRIDCPHAGPCCGNAFLDREEAEARTLKRDRVAAAVARVPALSESPAVEVAETVRAPATTAYRHEMTFAVAPAGPRSLVGVRDARGRVTDLPSCRVIARPLARRADELRGRVTPGLHDATVRVSTGRDPEGQVVLRTDRGVRFLGAEKLPLALGGIDFALSATTPLPPNLAQHPREVALAAEWLSAAPPAAAEAPLLAVHAGAGLHALPLARALNVPALLLEADRAAADDARAAIERAGLAAEARAADPGAELARLAAARERFRAVLLHVPHPGLSPDAAASLAALPFARAVALADEPERLARLLGLLRRHGLRTVRVVPVDAEPPTDRVRALALLERTTDPWSPPRLYEDAACAVLSKPGNLPSTGPDSLDSMLLAASGGERVLWPAHRLDAGTSGAILFAKTREAARTLGDAFAAGQIERRYLVLAAGQLAASGTIDRPLPEPGEPDKVLPAVTHYRRERPAGPHTLLAVHVDTGRTHQIRRHLAAVRHPVVGDARHGDPAINRTAAARAHLDRPFVHATSLSFRSPATGQPVHVESPLPADLAYALTRLGGNG